MVKFFLGSGPVRMVLPLNIVVSDRFVVITETNIITRTFES